MSLHLVTPEALVDLRWISNFLPDSSTCPSASALETAHELLPNFLQALLSDLRVTHRLLHPLSSMLSYLSGVSYTGPLETESVPVLDHCLPLCSDLL